MKTVITIDMRMINNSGIGTYISNVVPILIENMSDCHFNLIGTRERLRVYSQHSNVSIIECTSKIYSLREQIEIINKVPSSTDLLWIPHFNIPILFRGTLLVTIHDIFHLAMPNFVEGKIKKFYAKVIFRFVAKKAKKIITVSHFTKSEILHYLRYDPNDITVIHNGVNNSWYIAQNVQSQPDVPYILYVGNVKPHKNLKNLIKAFLLIQDRISHNLIIVGKKEGFLTGDEELVQFAEKYKHRIRFTGYIDDNKLKNLVRNADVFVFPSLYEGFGLPPLEAMACGTPTAVSDIAPLREVCGTNAVYFNPKDENDIAQCIKLLISDERKKKELSQNGRRWVENFSWMECAKQTEKVIRETISSNNHS
ncbi:glycosyltransferase family 4 protein [Sporolactobacillus spathodeae]|uniref:Glycosyltransferase involved in cell wall biosynthesis n=1 Tax=Sporolactobacillus spathodeae TaxID=1465502 RepID=A0ABS2Q862_9BACL|nr:glycosyltransferase family 1 protein [Sporolactobacillus spathodeae]MBM7657791.1 glycosyltransferase involved in cell wall biosynthesis [Sporolactobacillus spathodeae]